MYLKFRNLSRFKKQPKTADFVVAKSGSNHLFEDKNIEYLGQCDEAGNITIPAEQDAEWQAKTREQQLAELKQNTQKKTVAPASRRRGRNDIDDINDGPENENQDTYDEPDDDFND